MSISKLIEDINKRIEILNDDVYIGSQEKAALIKENTKFLVRCQQIELDKLNKNELFVVNAYRAGNRERHSYTVAVYSTKEKAIECAESHCTYRGGKYVCVVENLFLDKFGNEENDYTTDVYKTKIPYADITQRQFTQRQIEQLQSEVYKITSRGEIMALFNSLLGVNAGGGS